MKCKVEIFTAGCPVCDPVIKLVNEAGCDCDIIVYDLLKQFEDKNCLDKVKQFGIKNIPSIVVDGKLLDCCNHEITQSDLEKAGIGQA